jgi:hypothetical protein
MDRTLVTRMLGLPICLISLCCAQREFPEWKVAPIGLSGTWERAPAILVADLSHIAAVGVQRIKSPPWPASPDINRIYWCEGDLEVYSLIRGKVPLNGRKFLWGAATPGCDVTKVSYGRRWSDEAITHVWFIREEGGYLRPIVDAGGLYYYAFHTKWTGDSKEDPQERFAELLLTPSANDKTLREYAHGFFNLASNACFILGRPKCIEKINKLTQLGDADLRRAACDFLKSQFQANCAR